MLNLETIESLQAYGQRLHSDKARFSAHGAPRRGTVRELVRRVRRTG
jgi:hypothetical protein